MPILPEQVGVNAATSWDEPSLVEAIRRIQHNETRAVLLALVEQMPGPPSPPPPSP